MSLSTRKNSIGLPPAIPIVKKDLSGSFSRKDSLGWATDDFLGMISHTPPAFSPGSLEAPLVKRNRSGSISGRLRSASDLEDKGVIDRYQKGVLKDLIISGDAALQEALDKFEQGDPSALEALMDSGALNRKSSLDLLDELDFGFLNVGSLGNTPKDDNQSLDEWDDLKFDTSFVDLPSKVSPDADYESALGDSLPNSLPSMGMGITPPNPFSFGDDFLENKHLHSRNEDDIPEKDSPKLHTDNRDRYSIHNSSTTSRPIGIPGAKLSFRNSIDNNGKDSSNQKKFVGAYSPDSRRKRIEKFLEKRQRRVWTKKVKYDVRKNFADSRLRVKGRFVKKEDEQLLKELLSLT